MQDDDVVLNEITDEQTPPPPPAPPSGTFYRVDSSRATFGELWRDVRSPLVLFVWGSKLLRVKLPGSVNDPNVESLHPFIVRPSDLPPDVNARLEFTLSELRQDGFEAASYLAIVDLFHSSRTYAALLAHRDGQAIGRITLRTEGTSQKPKTHFFTEFLTGFHDGTFLQSSSAAAALNPPPGTRLNHQHPATPRQLWGSHKQAVTRETSARKQIVPVRGEAALLDLAERHHATVRDFHLSRKLFAPMQESDRAHAAIIADKYGAADRGELKHPDVMAELHKLQTKRTNWKSALIILAFSLALFIGAGFAQRWEALWLLVPILFFHELGHYLAMRIFGYQNLRMFFIPFLGAAVSGQNYTAPGWKKVIVALAGPLPGIVLGGVLGFAGIYYEKPIYVNAGLIALALNGFNLLPVLPLDGGRVMHTILFARHHLLDVTFRALAAFALAGLGALSGDKILLYLGIFMLIGVHAAYKLAKIATDLRRAGMRPADLPADHVIPPDVASPIIERVQAAFPRATGPKMVAQHTLHVYETLATRPPGLVASIFFGFVHGGSLVLAVIVALVIVFVNSGGFGDFGRFARAAASMPQTRLNPDAIVAWDAAPTNIEAAPTTSPTTTPAAGRNTIIATFDEPQVARSAFDEVKAQSPARARAVLFGNSVLLALPGDDADGRRAWVDRFDGRTKNVFVHSDRATATLTLTFLARNKAEADAVVTAINDGVRLGGSMHVIPAWLPDDRRTPEEKAKHEQARRTYEKLTSIANEAWKDPRLDEISKMATEAARRGDNAEAEKLETEQSKVYEEVRQAKLKALLASPDDSIDRDFAERFVALEAVKPEERFKRQAAELGPHMGQLPMAGDEPTPDARRYLAQFGFASNEGLLVSVRSLSFYDPSHGTPNFVAWLKQRGCIDFRYQFNRGLFEGLGIEGLEEE